MTCKRTFKTLAASTSALCLAATLAQADQVILDDLIVDGSICVGNDCVNGESFGFDTLRLKENNLRIKAQDTSSTASFPTNDWQLTFNDSSNGGQNKFSIDDIDNSRTPFTIEASAPSHSLYVDDGGRIGLGTSTPVVEAHIVDGDTPTLRLEQDGSSGFNAQTWDVAGNETNFFIRDASNGSKLPFRIQPSAPSNAIYVNNAGNIGLGTSTPDATLNVEKSGAAILVTDTNGTQGARDLLTLANLGNPQIVMSNTANSRSWELGAGQNFVIEEIGTPGNAFLVSPTGDMQLGGTCVAFNVNDAANDFHCTFSSSGVSCAVNLCP